jgi:hypothetical protein
MEQKHRGLGWGKRSNERKEEEKNKTVWEERGGRETHASGEHLDA